MKTLTLTDKELDALRSAFSIAFECNDEEMTGYSDELVDTVFNKLTNLN